MTPDVIAGLVAALASAVALNWGYWAQHRVASRLPPLSVRRPVHSLRLLFSNPGWTIGFSVGIGGWVLYVLALRVAPLSLVQAVSAGGVGVLAFLASRFGGVKLARRELAAVVVALAGLLGLALTLAGSVPVSVDGSLVGVLAWVAGSVVVSAVVALTGGRVRGSGAAFGVAAGVLYAAGDVVTKAAVAGGGRLALVTVMLACHGLAFVALQLGFQRGGVLATAGLASLLTNGIPIVAGVALFGEALPGGLLGVARVAAFAAVIVGGAGLASTSDRPRAAATTSVRTPVPDLPTGAW